MAVEAEIASTPTRRVSVAPAVLRSADVAVRTIVSVPAPPSTVSAPTKSLIVSLPAPALMLSAPDAPVIVSASELPVIEKPSLWLDKVIVTAAVAPETDTASTLTNCSSVAVFKVADVPVRTRVSVPAPPSTVSAPTKPLIVSIPTPALMLSAPDAPVIVSASELPLIVNPSV